MVKYAKLIPSPREVSLFKLQFMANMYDPT